MARRVAHTSGGSLGDWGRTAMRLAMIIGVFVWCCCEIIGGSGKGGFFVLAKQEEIQFRSDVGLHLPRTVGKTNNFEIRLKHFTRVLQSALEAEIGYSDEVLVDSIEHERKLLQYRKEKGVDVDITLHLPAMACGPAGRRHALALQDAVGTVYTLRNLKVLDGKRYTTVQTLYNSATHGSCYIFTGTEDDILSAEAAGFSVIPLPQPAKLSRGLAFTTNMHHNIDGAKSEMRASLSDNLLHRIEKKAVQDIYIHFSPTLLPRLREEEERLLRKWFARMANGGELLSDHWGNSISDTSVASTLLKGPMPLHSVAHHRRAFMSLDNAHNEVGTHECKWEEWQWEVLSRGGVARLETKRLSDGICLSVLIAYLASQPEVLYLEEGSAPVKMNQEAAWITQSGIPEHTTAWNGGLDGSGEVIGVADTGLDLYHCHFSEVDGSSPVTPCTPQAPTADFSKRKIVQYIAYTDSTELPYGHGTHVAGSAAGSTPTLSSGDPGMAHGAKIAVFDFGDSSNNGEFNQLVDVYSNMLAPLYTTGSVRVESNSWGQLWTGYTTLDRDFDSFVYHNPDMVVVAAAGNCQNVGSDDAVCVGIPQDGSSTVLAPAHAKNVIGVGATVNAQDGNELAAPLYSTVAFFSSQGPTPDGRIKPDVVAPGYPISSASAGSLGHSDNVCGFSEQIGTSMAAPIVAGNTAIIRQYFSQGWYHSDGMEPNSTMGFSPSAALVKAVLINSAKGILYAEDTQYPFSQNREIPPQSSPLHRRRLKTLGAPPDGAQGFGRITIDQGINVNGTVGIFFREESVVEGGTIVYEVTILPTADTSKDLSVTLVWTDPVNLPQSAQPVLHDLDLRVVDTSTEIVYYPNGLYEADRVNNVEKIVINPTTSNTTYMIYVTGTVVSETEQQRFSVVANGEFIETNDPPDPIDIEDDDGIGIGAFQGLLDSTWGIVLLVALALVVVAILISMYFSFCNRSRKPGAINEQEMGQNQGVPHGQMVITPTQNTPISTQVYPTVTRVLPTASAPPFMDEDYCPECGQIFNDPGALVLHVQGMHGGIARRPPPVL